MEITADIVKALRERTGVSVMQCKKALEEAGGDLDQAVAILNKNAGGAVAKKADRTLGAGAIGTYVHDGSIGAMIVLSSETDFVAKNPEFGALAREIAMQIAALDPADAAALLESPYIKDESKTMQDLISEATQKFGERIEISKFARFSAR